MPRVSSESLPPPSRVSAWCRTGRRSSGRNSARASPREPKPARSVANQYEATERADHVRRGEDSTRRPQDDGIYEHAMALPSRRFLPGSSSRLASPRDSRKAYSPSKCAPAGRGSIAYSTQPIPRSNSPPSARRQGRRTETRCCPGVGRRRMREGFVTAISVPPIAPRAVRAAHPSTRRPQTAARRALCCSPMRSQPRPPHNAFPELGGTSRFRDVDFEIAIQIRESRRTRATGYSSRKPSEARTTPRQNTLALPRT